MVEKRQYARREPHNVKNEGHICIGPECDRPAIAKRMCITHYKQLHRGGHLAPIGPVGRRPKAKPVENADNLPGVGYETE